MKNININDIIFFFILSTVGVFAFTIYKDLEKNRENSKNENKINAIKRFRNKG